MAMVVSHDSFVAFPLTREREMMIDGGRIAARRHTVLGLIAVDVTRARRLIRAYKARSGETLSFTAFVIACLGKAVDENKRVHAYRDWRNRLIVFDEVDVNMVVEIDMQGRKVVLPHFVRAANKRTIQDIHAEIRAVQSSPRRTREFQSLWFARLPRWVRDIFYGWAYRNPRLLKRTFCTVGVTAVGMFGTGGGWAIPFGVHTLDVALGGIAEKPGVVDGRIEIREYLCLTLCFDHDVIDGGPAARFTQRLKELIESGYGLDALAAENAAKHETAVSLVNELKVIA